MPGTDGLLHVSEIAYERVNDVRDVLKEGDSVMVKVLSIDPTGKVRLSKRALLPPPEGWVPPADGGDRPPRREGGGDRDRGGRGGDRGRGPGGGGRGGFGGNRGGR